METIYSIYKGDAFFGSYAVPMSSKNPDYDAKKAAGFTKKHHERV